MLSVDRPSTECRPITDRYIGQVSTNYRRSVGEVSVNEKLYQPRHIWNDYRPSVDQLSTAISTDCQPIVDRVSTEYRPTVDRVSTAISTDISVDITHSKQDPTSLHSPSCTFLYLVFIYLFSASATFTSLHLPSSNFIYLHSSTFPSLH